MDSAVTLSIPEGASDELFQELYRFRMTGAYCDAVLATDDGATYRVHKIALSSCSHYFRTLFGSLLSENSSGDGCKTYFHIAGVSSYIFETIIKYAYSGIVDVNALNVDALLTTADQFAITGIVEECIDFMLKNLSIENCIGVWRFGIDYYMPRLKSETRKFILENSFDTFENSKEFLHLKLSNMIDILSDGDLNATNEQHVWNAIKRWCKYKYLKRHDHIQELLPCVRLALLSLKDFQQIMDDPSVFKHAYCRSYIKMVSNYFLGEPLYIEYLMKDHYAASMFTPRYPYEAIVIIGGWEINEPSDVCEAYDCRRNMWNAIPQKEFNNRCCHQLAFLGEYIYVIGGYANQQILNSCFRIDASNFNTREVCPMREQRYYHSSAVMNDKIYVLGGLNGIRLKSVECYDPVSNQWTYISPMNERRSDASASALRNRIFIVGGYNGTDFLQSAECYYADFDQWIYLPPMMTCRSGACCVAIDNSVYAIGGFDGTSGLNSMEKYCLAQKQWFPSKHMLKSRWNFVVTVLENKIYVMGGYNSTMFNPLSSVDCFDLKKQKWNSVAPMKMARSGFTACTISGIKNVKNWLPDNCSRSLLKSV